VPTLLRSTDFLSAFDHHPRQVLSQIPHKNTREDVDFFLLFQLRSCMQDFFCAIVPRKQGTASVEEIKVVLFHIIGEISVWLKLKRQRRRLPNRP